MGDQLKMFPQQTSEVSTAATGSLALESGTTPSTSQAGETEKSGLDPAPAPASVLPERVKGLRILATSGLIGFDSSGSAVLQQSLESRLRRRLDTAGSTLFKLTWKGRRTPLGRRYLERAVSVLRTSGKGCTSVPTPQQTDGQRGLTSCDSANLDVTTQLATVPTPMAGSPATETYNAAGNNDYSRKIVELAMVATPAARDFKSDQASEEFHVKRWSHTRGKALTEQVSLAASGQTATGGTAETASIGQLNPAYSRWLMGLPRVWDECALRLSKPSKRK